MSPNCLTPLCWPPAPILFMGMIFMVVSFREYQRLCHVAQIMPLSCPFWLSFSVYLPPVKRKTIPQKRGKKTILSFIDISCVRSRLSIIIYPWQITVQDSLTTTYNWFTKKVYMKVMGYLCSIFHWDEQRGNGSSTNQTPPPRHSFDETCHCLYQVNWTACHCETCRICHWGHPRSQSRRKHPQHLHQSNKHMSNGMHRFLVQFWMWHNQHTWQEM